MWLYMAIMNINEFYRDNIKSKLNLLDNDACILLTIVEFIFSDCIQDLTAQLDSEFDSSKGRPAYPSCYVMGYYNVLL